MCYNIKQEVAIPPGLSGEIKGGADMIAGIGLDLCDIERMKRAIERPRFIQRIYTAAEAERIVAASEIRRAEIAAGLFSAKEAVSKALGTGLAGIGTDEIEITPDEAGCPRCALHGKAQARARALCGEHFTVWVSITHESGMAAATAVIESQTMNQNE